MEFYFTKNFIEFNLGDVKYYRCKNCGFVASKTHYEMPLQQWEELNLNAHLYYNSMGPDPKNQPPPYLQQALMLFIMKHFKFFSGMNWLDVGSGEGKLAKIFAKLFFGNILCFDEYIRPGINPVKLNEIADKKFDLVINSAVFEHVTNRKNLNFFNSFVAPQGALAIHTLIREEIPNDPDWFYLLPVHSAFHTNKSMEILMEQWNYKCSIYCLLAKTWVLFKDDSSEIEKQVNKINELFGYDYLMLKKGFMNFWMI